jgi:hypothetical protein
VKNGGSPQGQLTKHNAYAKHAALERHENPFDGCGVSDNINQESAGDGERVGCAPGK